MSKLKAGDVAMWATTDADGPGRPEAAQTTDCPLREVLPRRQDLPAVRGHGPGAAAGDLADAAARVPGAAPSRPRPARCLAPPPTVGCAAGFRPPPEPPAECRASGRATASRPRSIARLCYAPRELRLTRCRACPDPRPPRLRRPSGSRSLWHVALALHGGGLLGPLDPLAEDLVRRAHGPAPADRRHGRAVPARRAAHARLRLLPPAAAAREPRPLQAAARGVPHAAPAAGGDARLGGDALRLALLLLPSWRRSSNRSSTLAPALSFVGAALLVWWSVIEPKRRRLPGDLWKVPYLLGARLAGMFLGHGVHHLRTPAYDATTAAAPSSTAGRRSPTSRSPGA